MCLFVKTSEKSALSGYFGVIYWLAFLFGKEDPKKLGYSTSSISEISIFAINCKKIPKNQAIQQFYWYFDKIQPFSHNTS